MIIVSNVEDQAKAIGLGADIYGLKPIERRWLLDNLNRLTRREGEKRILLIDDEEVTRYWLKGLLATTGASILETPHGLEGIRMARELQPQVILLDLVMAVMRGRGCAGSVEGRSLNRKHSGHHCHIETPPATGARISE